MTEIDSVADATLARVRSQTIGDIPRRTARRVPDKVAIIDGDVTLTFAQFDALVDRVAAALHANGLAAGDRVALLSRNSWQYAVLAFATARAAVVLVPVNFMLTGEEIALATGDWRRQAEELFDKPNTRSDATRLVARAVSVLPESHREDTQAGHKAAWDAALAAPGPMLTVEGVQLGRQMFQACKTTVDQSLKWALRKCLENRLDEKQKEINQDYWDQQGGV